MRLQYVSDGNARAFDSGLSDEDLEEDDFEEDFDEEDDFDNDRAEGGFDGIGGDIGDGVNES